MSPYLGILIPSAKRPKNMHQITSNGALVLAGHSHQDHTYDIDGNELSPESTKRPLFIQTPSASAQFTGFPIPGAVGYRIVRVEDKQTYPQEYTDITTVGNIIKRIVAWLGSPGELHAYDSLGRHVGLLNSGEEEWGIPDSAYIGPYVVVGAEGHYETSPETIIVFEPSDDYLYEVVGTEQGTYGLHITSTGGGEETSFEAVEIPTSPGSRHVYMVDWSALSAGEEGVYVDIDADGDGIFERSITADSELTALEFSGVPVADAGPDQTVEQSSYYGAEVALDGSGSTDPESTPGTNDDIVAFDWYEGQTFLGSGETFDHTFGVGEHAVTLLVIDSWGLTDEDEVVITVTGSEPSASQLWIFPTVILRDMGDWQIMAMLRLREGVTKDQIDLDQPLLLYPGEIEATRQYAVQSGGRWRPRTTIFAFFNKDSLMAAVPADGPVELLVAGQLKTGTWFGGTDTVRIVSWGPWEPWWEFLLDYSD